MKAMRRVGPGQPAAVLVLVLVLCALPLFALIVGLAVDQFGRQRAALLADTAALADEQLYAMTTMVAEARRQLDRMRMTVETGLTEAPPPVTLYQETAIVPAGPITGTTLGPDAQAGGSLIGLPDLVVTPQVGAALAMLDVVAREAELGSPSYWSYYFSSGADFITIHPAVPLAELAGAAEGIDAVDDLIDHWLSYDVYRLGTPDQNPDRAAYWTPVYEDAGGAGTMVSHAAPIYDGDRFLGIVGTDILTARFEEVLAHMRQPVGYLAVADERGGLLAIDGVSFGGDAARLRAHWAGIDAPDSLSFHRRGDAWLLARPIPGSPFRLVHVIPAPELTAWLLPHFFSYGLILTGLGATILLLLVVLHRHYIRPSFALGEYVAALAASQHTDSPRLPKRWIASLTRIDAAFRGSREYRARLEDSEARLLAATESLPDGLAIIDPDGQITFANPAFHRLLGREQVPEPTDRPVAVGDRWLTCQHLPMTDDGTVIVLRDVTAARAADQDLRDSEARYRTVVNTQTEFVARYTPEGHPTFANDAYCRYMKMTPAELFGRGASDFDYILPEDRVAHDAHLRALTPEAPTATTEFRSILPDGTFHWEEWTDTAIFDSDGTLTEIQAVGRDITERKITEEALRQTEKMAALGSLLAGVAHELNNPLSIVVGYAGMLLEFAPDEATRRRAREIHTAAERCARIVRTFLAMARSRPAERKPVDLSEVMADVMELAAYGLRSNGVTVVMAMDPDLPQVLADRDQLHQVFMNLALNAQQA